MKTTYHASTDALSVRLTDAEILESEEVHPGLIIDYDQTGKIVGFEILDAQNSLAGGWLQTEGDAFTPIKQAI